MRSDRHSYPSDGCNALWKRFVHENRGGPTLVTDWHRSPVTSLASPSPTPQNPRQIDRQTDRQMDGCSELIYMIYLGDLGPKSWKGVSSYLQGWSHVFKTILWNNDWVFRIDIKNGKNETSHVIRSSIVWNHPSVLNFELAKVLIIQKCFLVIHIWTKL
jgi:hypothetical protein